MVARGGGAGVAGYDVRLHRQRSGAHLRNAAALGIEGADLARTTWDRSPAARRERSHLHAQPRSRSRAGRHPPAVSLGAAVPRSPLHNSCRHIEKPACKRRRVRKRGET